MTLNRFIIIVGLLLSSLCGWAQSAPKRDAVIAYNDGLAFYNKQNYAAALPYFRSAVSIDASFAVARQCLAVCYDQTDDVKAAIGEYEVLAENTQDEKLLYNLAVLYKNNGQLEKSAGALERALKIKPTYSKASYLLGQLQAASGDNASAVKSFSKDENPTAKAQYSKALAMYKAAQYEDCIATISKIEDKDRSADACYLQGLSAEKLDRNADAKAFYNDVIKRNSQHADANLNCGIILFNEGNYAEAQKYFEVCSRVNPKDPYTGYFLGRTYLVLGKVNAAVPYLREATIYIPDGGEARKYLDEALSKLSGEDAVTMKNFGGSQDETEGGKRDPNISKKSLTYFNEGVAAYQAQDYKTAMNKFDKAASDSPKSAHVQYYLGVASREAGKVEQSRKAFAKTIKLDPNYAKAYTAIGNFYYGDADYNPAAENYEAAITKGDEHDDVYFNLGNSFYQMNNYPKAIINYKKAISLNPNEADYHLNLGMAYRFKEEFKNAIAAYEAALKLDPEYLDAHYGVAETYLAMGNDEKALEKALAVNDEFPDFAPPYLIAAKVYDNRREYDKVDKYKKRAYKLDSSLK